MTADGVPQGGGGRPGWAGLLLVGVVVLMVASLALFGGFGEHDASPISQPRPTTTSEAAAPTSTKEPSLGAAVGGEPVLVSTVLGQMEWRRVTGTEFDSVERSLDEGGWPVGEEGVDWGLVAWPPSGWMVSDRGILDDAGLGARLLLEGWERLPDGWVRSEEGWERLEVEDSGVLIRVDWTVAGPGGVVLIGEPYGSGAPIGWVLSNDGIFELVGPLPFHPDHLEGSRGWPMVLPVADGFVGIGRRDPGLVLTPGPGQELWWSEDGRSWALVEDAPFGGVQDWVYSLAGYGGRWVAIGYSEITMSGEQPVWVSEDGLSWQRVTENLVEFDPAGWGGFMSVVGGELGWVIFDAGGERDCPVWLSRDGTQWQALPMEGLVGKDEWCPGDITVGTDTIVVADTWQGLGWVGTLVREWSTTKGTLTALPIVEVRLEGGAFFERATAEDDIRRGRGDIVAPETVIDGVFFAHFHQWDEGPVWWEGGAINPVWGDQQPRWIELDLGGNVIIEAATVQADDNDEYLLSYRDLTTGEWGPLWRIPHETGEIIDPADIYVLDEVFPEPVTTDLLRFEAWSGDGMYSVSEIKVFGPPDPTTTGTITLSVQDWSGVNGYRLLAAVWTEGFPGLVGGAFWTLIDSDPFSGTDIVHPLYWGEDPPGVEYDSWGEWDYLWDETAQLEPGTYQIEFWANPGALAPYGSHIPAEPIERMCWVDVEVVAGETSTVAISDVPVGDGPCPLAGP